MYNSSSSDKVIGKIIEECKIALMECKPIIHIRTNELEIINRVIKSNELVVRISRDASEGQADVVYKPVTGEKALFLMKSNRLSQDNDDINVHYGKSASFDPVSDGFQSVYILDGADVKSEAIKGKIVSFIENEVVNDLNTGSIVIIYGENVTFPAEISSIMNYCRIIDEPYPDAEEIKEYLQSKGHFTGSGVIDALLGFPLMEMERIVNYLDMKKIRNGEKYDSCLVDEESAMKAICKQKEQLLKKDNLLELIHVPKKADALDSSVGGMKVFKNWIQEQKRGICNSAALKRSVGVGAPKGVLMCGIPGCGKSLAVESVASVLNLPLLKMDISRFMGSKLGESEHNMLKAIKIAEAMAPCVLFLDELDKAFSGAKSSNDNDSGTFKRMFGTFLGWMQSCRKPCFIFATANDLSGFPDEFFRSGRFDGLFSIFMPTRAECIDIFKIQMSNAEGDTDGEVKLFDDKCYDIFGEILDKLAENSRFVSGADINKIVSMALRSLWNEDRAVNRIHSDVWKRKIYEVLEKTTVYGESRYNLDSIALCYIRLINKSFKNTCEHPLFTKEDYIVEETVKENAHPSFSVTIRGCDDGKAEGYDALLRQTIGKRMKVLGELYEQHTMMERF